MSKLDNIVIITGPTCTGKTEISIKLVDIIPEIEIISADSMQIYKYMNIGTAKPNNNILHQYKHHCIDIINPFINNFDVMKYTKCAKKAMDEILQRNKKPLIVGGTGLYIKALTNPIFIGPGRDAKIRKKLNELIIKNGNLYLFKLLKSHDPEYSLKITPNDIKRIIRALEVYYLTGKPISFYHKQSNIDNSESNERENNGYFIICLTMNREKLYQNINARVEQMIEKGLIEETKNILEKHDHMNTNAIQSLGYKQIILYLKGYISKNESIELIKKETRHFAKRQLSWFKNQINVNTWINLSDYNNINECIEKIYKILKSQGY